MRCALIAAMCLAGVPAFAGSLKTLVAFDSSLGTSPMGQLAADSAGRLWGTTINFAQDTIFEVTFGAHGATAARAYAFVPGAVGYSASPGLTIGSDGALYGATTANNGSENSGCGSIYRFVPGAGAGAISRLNERNIPFGCYPNAPVNVDAAGRVYADLQNGPYPTYGAISAFSPPAGGGTKWAQQALYFFKGHLDGIYPSVPLLLTREGALVGTAIPSPNGNHPYPDAVFALEPPAQPSGAWQFSTLHTFPKSECAAGVQQLVEDSDGSIVGPCSDAVGKGGNQPGMIFRLSPPAGGQRKWTFARLWRFSGGADGGHPHTAVTLDGSGNIYGTASDGNGTIFRLSPAAAGGYALKTLWRFTGGADGATPSSPLILTSRGTLIGTAAQGGSAGGGTLFEVTP